MSYRVKRILFIFLCLSMPFHTLADTIYQWSDPWGQIQYSKTPVPGATVSDLTELPETSSTTEQQKQDAMVRKLQEMRQRNGRRNNNAAVKQQLNMQAITTKNNCKQLRILMADIQAYHFWQHPILNAPVFPNPYSQHLQFELSSEFRKKCR